MLKDRDLLIKKFEINEDGESIKVNFIPNGEPKMLESYILEDVN